MIGFLPVQLQSLLIERYGCAGHVEPLSGLTDASVWRLHFTEESVIVKRTTNANEAFFYKQVAPKLQDAEVPIPELLFLECKDESVWIVLEYIPRPFPKERWLADGEQLSILRRLHQIDGGVWRTAPTLFRPEWTAEMNEAALTWFAGSEVGELQQQLDCWRYEARPLFEPNCLISGDPNPLNWGLRLDGTLVHFDWERFGWGTPALDLAITVPGLGIQDEYETLALAYSHRDERAATEILVRQIKLAKAWAVVELLATFRQQEIIHKPTLNYLVNRFPSWLKTWERCEP